MLKYLFFSLCTLSFAADCDVAFTFTPSTGTFVQFNNKAKACANWQFTYYSSGYSALNIIIESATDAGQTPGTWATFAGTVASGSNPQTATTQGTATFTNGAFPWMRVRLASSSGSGVITGRLLGVQLTSAAIGFIQSGYTGSGTFIAPIAANFTWFDQGAAVTSDFTTPIQTIGIDITPADSSDIRRKRCTTLTSTTDWTLYAAVAFPMNMSNINSDYGISLYDSGSSREQIALFDNLASSPPVFTGLYNCAANTLASCLGAFGTTNNMVLPTPVVWVKVVRSSGGSTITWTIAEDGVNFFAGAANWVATAGNFTYLTPTHVCIYNRLNDPNWRAHVKLYSWNVTYP